MHAESPWLITPVTNVAPDETNNAGPPESMAHGCDGAGVAVNSTLPTDATCAVPVRFRPASAAAGEVTPNPTTENCSPTNDASTVRESSGSGAVGAVSRIVSSPRSLASVAGSNAG